MAKRPTQGAIIDAQAYCCRAGCAWHTEGKNALALAAQHYDRTGHAVQVEEQRVTWYGEDTDTRRPPPGA